MTTLESLKFKVNGSQYNKPKIYVCYYENDEVKYLFKVIDEILSKANCVVYYNDSIKFQENIISFEEFKIQLYVIIVSQQFLNNFTDIVKKELKTALDLHIPILPLMMEDCSITDYQKCFGNIQYIKFYEKAINPLIDKKLKNYFDSILLKNDDFTNIKNSFKNQLFLSYRKKDIQACLQIIKLIHNVKKYRNIAIWYDDYLVIGEDFNENIKNEINKSDAFILCITPNMIENDNYVMKIEYPYAYENKLLIIPIEHTFTERNVLETCFKNIPACVQLNDIKKIEYILDDVIKNCKENYLENEIEKNYYIGLAYLFGINVEINKDYAYDFIYSSAKKEFVPAIEKLVNMYRTGNGVELNFDKSINWQIKLVDIYKENYEKKSCIENWNVYMNSLLILSDYYIELKKFNEAIPVLNKVFKVSEQNIYLSEGKINYTAIEMMSNSMEKLGKIYLERNDYDSAKECLFKSFQYEQLIFESLLDLESALNLVHKMILFADNERNNTNYVTAIKIYLNAKDILLKFASKDNPRSFNQLLIMVNTRAASSMIKMNDGKFIEVIIKCLNDALYLAEEVDKEYKDIESKQSIAIILEKLGQLHLDIQDYNSAMKYFNMQLEINTKLIEKLNNLYNQRMLAITYEKLGFVHYEIKDFTKSEIYFIKCIELRENIIKTANSIDIKRELFYAYELIAKLYTHTNDKNNARKYFKLAIEIINNLSVNSNLITLKEEKIIAYYDYSIFLILNKSDEGQKNLLYAFDLAKELFILTNQSERSGIFLKTIRQSIEKFYPKEKIDKENATYEGSDINKKKELDDLTYDSVDPAYNTINSLSFNHETAKRLIKKGEMEKALEILKLSIEKGEKALEMFKENIELLKLNIKICITTYGVVQNLKILELKKYFIEKSIKFQKNLLALENTLENKFDLVSLLLGDATVDMPNINIDSLNIAMEYLKDILNQHPNNEKAIYYKNVIEKLLKNFH